MVKYLVKVVIVLLLTCLMLFGIYRLVGIPVDMYIVSRWVIGVLLYELIEQCFPKMGFIGKFSIFIVISLVISIILLLK